MSLASPDTPVVVYLSENVAAVAGKLVQVGGVCADLDVTTCSFAVPADQDLPPLSEVPKRTYLSSAVYSSLAQDLPLL